MIKNYIKTAFRNLRRNKAYAFLNVAGLAIGIASCLLLFLIVQFESSYDNFHNNRKNIYRLVTEFHNEDGVSYSDAVPFPATAAVRADFPQLKKVAAIYREEGQVTIRNDNSSMDKKFDPVQIYYTEPEFFDIFNFRWLAGTANGVLSAPNSAALTKQTAEKFFTNWKDAIGKTFVYGNRRTYKIAGIIDNPPANSDFPFQVIASYTTLKQTNIASNMTDWVSTFGGADTYVVLPDNVSPVNFNKLLLPFTKKYKPAEYAKDGIILQPLSDIHYDDRFGNYSDYTFSRNLINALAMIGVFLIIIACVNFINLATAQAVNRSKEVGIRKVMGSNRYQLAVQFLGETAIIAFFAIVLAIGIAYATLPALNKLLNLNIAFNFIGNPLLIIFLVAVFILVTLLSGLYPAIVLSGFNPINALKSKITSKMIGGLSLRRGLVVFQFAIAHILIIGTIVVVSQANFFRNASLGFDKAAIINVPIPGDSISVTKYDLLRNEFKKNPDIENVSLSFASPSDNGNWNSDFKFDHSAKATAFDANLKWADVDYFKTYNLEFIAGRPYYPSDTVREFVVNQNLVSKMGIRDPKEALGKEINFWDGVKKGPIVGVIKDFNVASLRRPMKPVILSTWKRQYQLLNIKIKPGREKQVLSYVEKEWNNAFPDYVYQYTFLDKKIENFYTQESQLSQLYTIFAAIAIFISCLGLYGLVSFMAAQRVKEVGIRKVLGASVANIVYLFSKEFTVLILVAFCIAAPLAYYFMHKWLQDFSYRIPLGAGDFILAIVASIIIAWITVGYRAIRAALTNPVKSLRTE
ncbi:MAG: ABC transporter permease [Chitinophagaceae bacterium]